MLLWADLSKMNVLLVWLTQRWQVSVEGATWLGSTRTRGAKQKSPWCLCLPAALGRSVPNNWCLFMWILCTYWQLWASKVHVLEEMNHSCLLFHTFLGDIRCVPNPSTTRLLHYTKSLCWFPHTARDKQFLKKCYQYLLWQRLFVQGNHCCTAGPKDQLSNTVFLQRLLLSLCV